MNKTAYIPDRIFTGDRFITGHALAAADGVITAVLPADKVPAGIPLHPLPGLQLAPALIDLQIYGGNGAMFSLFPSVQALTATYQYCLRGGASRFMATVATNSPDIVSRAIEAARDYRDQGLPGLLGLHLEGPYLNPLQKGAHLPAYIRQPAVDEVKALLRAGDGLIRMMTLAPECCSEDVIRLLLDEGVIVSAGHSDATYGQALDAFRAGIPAATHLYNAMSPLRHRAPGLVGAIFDGAVSSSIVADGIHVDYPAVRIAKKIMQERLFLITDAITEARSGSYTYIRQDDRYVTENGTLAGSCLTMGRAVRNLISHVGIDPGEALRMASLYPARVAGIDRRLGRILPGYAADCAVLDEDFQVRHMIIAGKLQ